MNIDKQEGKMHPYWNIDTKWYMFCLPALGILGVVDVFSRSKVIRLRADGARPIPVNWDRLHDWWQTPRFILKHV
jgi:hypothetical protein